MSIRMPPAHQWVVILWAAAAVVGAFAGGGIWFALLLFGMLGILAWEYVRHRDRSDDPDTYGLWPFIRDMWDED